MFVCLFMLMPCLKGLYHGKDVRSGYTISHSHARTLRRFLPNVISKRIFSDALDAWLPFKMTTAALKGIDKVGGIDKYLLSLDNPTVAESNYITKMRGLVASSLYHRGQLSEHLTKKLGYHVTAPALNIPMSDLEKEGKGRHKVKVFGRHAKMEANRENEHFRNHKNR